jgi:uncharacterized membrane protein YbhN (UPF0104 family)
MVSISQLGKYVPGGIWHFVGRAALYAEQGLRPAAIINVLVHENTWQWASAILIGTCLLLPHFVQQLGWPLSGGGLFLCLLPALLLVWWATFQLARRWFPVAEAGIAAKQWRTLCVQLGAWLCFGFSFWMLLPGLGGTATFAFTTGLFAGAAFAGFLVPLAPAGLGVREFVLTAGLSQYMPMYEAVTCAAVSRLIWIAVEVGLSGALYAAVGSDVQKGRTFGAS